MISSNKSKRDFFISIITVISTAVITSFFITRYTRGGQFLAVLAGLGILMFLTKPIYWFYPIMIFFWYPSVLGNRVLSNFLPVATLAEIYFYVCFLLFIGISALKKRDIIKYISNTPLLLPIILFFIGACISFRFGGHFYGPYEYALFRKNCIYGPLVYLLATGMIRRDLDSEMLSLALLIGTCLFGVYIYSHYYGWGGAPLIDAPGRLGTQDTLKDTLRFYINPNLLGHQMAMLIPLATAFYVGSKKIYQRYISIIAVIFLCFILAISGARAAMAGAFCGICVVLLLSLRFGVLSFSKLFLSLRRLFFFAITVVIAGYILGGFNEMVSDRLQSIIYFQTDPSYLGRTRIWLSLLKLFLQNPIGMGFREVYNLGYVSASPHSVYLSLGLQTGILGLGSFLWFIIAWGNRIFISLKNTQSVNKVVFIAVIGGMSAFLVGGFFEHLTYNASINMFTMWALCGIGMGHAAIQIPLTKQGRQS